ncbi:hypothetical protein ACLB2K_072649 [Fragaria x ananassa]
MKNGGDNLPDLRALQLEDMDSSVQPNPSLLPTPMSYANSLINLVDRFHQTMTEEFEFTKDDCVYSPGISLICFECGCFGHAKDKCPSVHVTTDVANNENKVNSVSDVNVDNVMLDTQNFDDKMKSAASSGKNKTFNNSTSNMENTTSPSKHPSSGSDLSKTFVKEKAALTMHSKLPARSPMKDVSNTSSGSGPKIASHYQRKSKGVSSSTTKNQSQVSKKLSFGNMEGISFGSGISAVFGHFPPEEGLKAQSTDIAYESIATSDFVDKTFASNNMVTFDDILPSHAGEG